MQLTLDTRTYLGPAHVTAVAGNSVHLDLPDGPVWARTALAFPYQPEHGDEVLAVGQEGSWYVIGVLNGRGTTTLTVPADLHIQAPRGVIELRSAHGIHLTGPTVRITARKLDLLARTMFERFGNATRWVRDALQLRAGRVRTLVRSSYRLKAARIDARAEHDVKVDGAKIHLG